MPPGEPVARVVFVFLTDAEPVDRPLVDLDAASAEVRRLVAHIEMPPSR